MAKGYAAYLVTSLLMQKRMWTLWFLACLFFLNLLFFLAVKCLKKSWRLAILSVAMMILGLFYYKEGENPLLWNMDACLMAFPFFFAGSFYKERHVVLDKYLDDRRVSPVIFSKWFTIHPLRYIGEHSLLYFAWHQTIVMPLAWTVVSHIQLPFSKTIPWAAYGISLALQTVIILVFLTLCNEMMRRTKLRFMLGKFGDD